MKKQIWSSLTLSVVGILSLAGAQSASAQSRFTNYGPRCGLLRSDVRVKNNGFTGTSTFEKQNFLLDPERGSQATLDLTQKMRLDRMDCENFRIYKVRVWAYRNKKTTDTEVSLTLDGRTVARYEVPHSPSKTPKKILFNLEDKLGDSVRLMADYNRMRLEFDGDGTVRIDRIEVEWELDPVHFNYRPGFDPIRDPRIGDDSDIVIDSQTGNVIIVNGNDNQIVIGNNNVVSR